MTVIELGCRSALPDIQNPVVLNSVARTARPARFISLRHKFLAAHFKHNLRVNPVDNCQRQRFTSTSAMQREDPGPGQESVWDYPRPPRLEPVPERITVELGGKV